LRIILEKSLGGKMAKVRMILVLLCAIFILLGCETDDVRGKTDSQDNGISIKNFAKLDSIASLIQSNGPAEYPEVLSHVRFLLGLKSNNDDFAREAKAKYNLDSLFMALEKLPVETTEITITRNWLSEEEVSRKEKTVLKEYKSVEPDRTDRISFIETTKTNAERRAKKLHEENPYWDKKECMLIIERKIWMGMSKDQLVKSWGRPNDINRTVGSWGSHEQWVYGDFGPYVYVENGTVTSWQD
jgi:hypothetical protein